MKKDFQYIRKAMKTPVVREATAAETASALIAFFASDRNFKADVIDELVDQLVGTDATAIVGSIKGLPAEYTEFVSDGLCDALKAALKKRWDAE